MMTRLGHSWLQRVLPAIALAGLGGACGGDDLLLPNEGQPATVAAVRGDRQNGTAGEPVSEMLVVEVKDRFGNPVGQIEVSWQAEGGGSADPSSSVTGVDGRAATSRILGPQPGTYTTVATVAALPGTSVIFTATAVAAQIAFTTQPAFSATSGIPLDRQPVLQLQDTDGAPIARSNVAVTAQIASGGGTLGGVTTAVSNAEGVIAFTDLAIRGSPGTRTLIFAADGFASAVSGPIGVGVGGAASIELAAGDQQTATVGSAVPIAPAVLVRDATGNPVQGVPIQFTVASGGGSVSGAAALTGADGQAVVGQWVLGEAAGANTLRASVTGAELTGSPVTFTATGQPGPVSGERSQVSAAPTSIAASTGSSTITVTALDAFGNALPGLPAVLSATGEGNQLTQPDAPTGSSGEAAGRFSASGLGSHVVSATIGGTLVTQTATVTITAGAPSAAASSATVPDGTAGSPTSIDIQLRDATGNLVSGQAGAIVVRVSGANSSNGLPVADRGGGNYRAAYTPIAAGTDRIEVRVDGTPVSGSPFASDVAPGPASPAHSDAVVTRTGGVFSTIEVVVTARDAQGNPVGRGGEQVRVQVNNGAVLDLNDNGDGTYSGAIFAFGFQFSVDITMNGAPIRGSPYQV
ncbi:MAG: hypothetical protein H0T44_08325 [Gemmatimonadales bacterium]|nr:hypothetical protein [Gemmatimonadales bacterium]